VKFLADVNVVFPLLVDTHQHHRDAIAWFDSTAPEDVALCRMVRLGALRLLCNAQVMGADVVDPGTAFSALEALEADERIVLVHEPDGLDAVLQPLVERRATSPNLWGDAYLAAFAITAGLKLASFDRGFTKFPGLDFLPLSPRRV